MRMLSMKQAARCESAKNARCRCRCRGLLHGAKRGLDATFFEGLPQTDPHRAMERSERPPRPKTLAAAPLFDEEA